MVTVGIYTTIYALLMSRLSMENNWTVDRSLTYLVATSTSKAIGNFPDMDYNYKAFNFNRTMWKAA